MRLNRTRSVVISFQVFRNIQDLSSQSKPLILSVMFGVQSFFDVLMIIISVYNALEWPHRNQSEVITSLQTTGSNLLGFRQTIIPAKFTFPYSATDSWLAPSSGIQANALLL
ncbi:hypothetical protein C8R43DRAFT_510616 [Mycena crocata]|nr:hypothetical protein C8R43DRAFT_510616 [Mycena crocata]